jgi:hypothetical protein
MRKKSTTQEAILKAFDQSKVISEACRIAGVSTSCFYFHFYKNPKFRRQVLEKRREHLAERIAEAG